MKTGIEPKNGDLIHFIVPKTGKWSSGVIKCWITGFWHWVFDIEARETISVYLGPGHENLTWLYTDAQKYIDPGMVGVYKWQAELLLELASNFSTDKMGSKIRQFDEIACLTHNYKLEENDSIEGRIRVILDSKEKFQKKAKKKALQCNHKQSKIEYLEAKIKVLETENSMLKNVAIDKVFGG